jgi:hypothetical protein
VEHRYERYLVSGEAQPPRAGAAGDAQGHEASRLLRIEPPQSNTATRIGRASVMALVVAVAAPLVTAQSPTPSRGAGQDPGCLPRASRIQESCEGTRTSAKSEKEVTFSLEIPAAETAQCAATIEFSYTQRGSMASVEGTIENEDCGASGGDYELLVSIRNENGELKILEFPESWQRQDDHPVKFASTYPIGENVDLVRVRSAKLKCTCFDAP